MYCLLGIKSIIFYQNCLCKTNLVRSRRFILQYNTVILLDPNSLNFCKSVESAFNYLVSNLGWGLVATWPETTISECAVEKWVNDTNGRCDESLNLHLLCCLKMRRWGFNSVKSRKNSETSHMKHDVFSESRALALVHFNETLNACVCVCVWVSNGGGFELLLCTVFAC